MEKIRINYTDNTKDGVRKKKVQNTINKIDHMIYEINLNVKDLQYRAAELANNIAYMENIKLELERNGKVDKNDLRECEFLYDEVDLPF